MCVLRVHAQPTNFWIQKSAGTPTWTDNGATFTIGAKGYFFAYSNLYEYDPVADGWTQKATMPGPTRNIPTAFTIGSKAYVGLGYYYNGSAFVDLKDFWEYDPATNAWTQKTDFPGAARAHAIGFAVGSKGYMGGGSTLFGSLLTDFYEYTPSTNSWLARAPVATASVSYYQDAVTIGSKGYYSTGGNQFWEYDPAGNVWTRKADNPSFDARHFAVGSSAYFSSTSNTDSSYYEYKPAANTWTKIGEMPMNRSQYYTFTVGTKAYMFGGLRFFDHGGGVTSYQYMYDILEFTPPSGVASCLPVGEQAALSQLYADTKGWNWTHPWTGTDESTWYGVRVVGCKVRELKLSRNNIIGLMPNRLPNFSQLDVLDLSDNNLSGGLPALPASLTSLDLSGNNVAGNIPVSLPPNLLYLDISSNKISGSIPTQLWNVTQLRKIDLSNNALTGSFPEDVINVSSLDTLNLSGNQLSGSLPVNMWHIPATHVDVSRNDFSGAVPEPNFIDILLRSWNLSYNRLTDLSSAIGQNRFRKLDVSHNLIKSIPPMDNSFTFGVDLNISYNYITFTSLEPNSSSFSYGATLTYSPQLEFERATLASTVGDAVSFEPPIDSTLVTYYQWYKNGVAIPGATYRKLAFSSVQASDEGIYTLKEKNHNYFSGMELTANYFLNLNSSGTGVIPASEREALQWFYYSTGGPNWTSNTNWLNNDESTWVGVTVDAGHVTELSFYDNGLTGELPKEIGNLTNLTRLYLSAAFANRPHLNGTLPEEIGNLTQLHELNLTMNAMSGPLPRSLGKLTSLYDLYIYQNFNDGMHFTGSLPREMGDMTSLVNLTIIDYFSPMNGDIPSSFSNLTQLSSVVLQGLGLRKIAPSFFSLPHVYQVDMYQNALNESPAPFATMPALQYLRLDNNPINTTLPEELRSVMNVSIRNCQLTGTLPANLGTSGSKLRQLDVSFNQMSGPLPVQMGTWTDVYYINLRGNLFDGAMPKEIGTMTAIQTLDLGQNQLSGTIPKEISSAAALLNFYFDHNQITGTIPPEFGTSHLINWSIAANQITGTIPPEIGNITSLRYLEFSSNQLTGGIPSSFGNLTQLTDLGLNNNQLSGAVNSALSGATNLSNLRLQDNQFTGAFPTSIATLPLLRYVQLQNNLLTDLPQFSSPKGQLYVYGNFFDFGDLEPNAGLGGFAYSPQNTVFNGGSVSSNIGCPMTIPFTTPGAQNTYQWYKDGTAVAGATSQAFSLAHGASSDDGNYKVEVRNTLVPGLMISSADWIVNVNGPPISSPGATGGASCTPATVTLNAVGAVSGQQYKWYDAPSGGAVVGGSAAFTTPVLSTTTSYYVTLFETSSGCESFRVPAIAQISSATPTATDGNACGPSSSVTLGASGGASGQYRWYGAPTGGTAFAGETSASYITPVLGASTTYYVSIDNGSCEGARVPVVATIVNLTAPSQTGGTRCGPGTVTLSASGATNGQYRWYLDNTTSTPIAGEVNASMITSPLTSSTSYFVSINNGTCESVRTPVIATITSPPSPPTVTGGSGCSPSSTVTITAAGAANGQYLWYSQATGGTPIPGQVNGSFTTPQLSSTTTYYVSINNGCESSRQAVTAEIKTCPKAPVIETAVLKTTIGGTASVDLLAMISTFGSPVDPSSVTISQQPASGALASIASGRLRVDYSGIAFSGTDRLSVRACDQNGLCAVQEITVEVAGEMIVFNALSPNGDGKNEIFFLQNIESLADMRENRVMIFNRWGDNVFEVENYDNVTRVFRGLGRNGEPLPAGTYYYKIEFVSGLSPRTGFVSLRK